MRRRFPFASVALTGSRSNPRRSLLAVGLAVGLVLGSSCWVKTEASTPATPGKPLVSDANSVIAGYLVNFLRYVEWPVDVPPAREPWRIGVLEAGGLGPSLGRLTRGKTVRGRSIIVTQSSAPAELLNCHLVMLPESFPANPADAAVFSGRPILTVAFHEKSAAAEGCILIELVLQERKIRYRLNPALLAARGLKPIPGLLENALPPSAPAAHTP